MADEYGGAEAVVGEFDVIEVETGYFFEFGAEPFRGIGFAAGGGLLERTRELGGEGSLRRGEVLVAGAEGDAIGVADGGDDGDFDRDVEVADHAADDVYLLGVFLAEVGGGGADEVEEFEDDGGDAAEMAGAGGAVAALGDSRFLDEGGVVGEIEIAGGKDEVGAGLATEGEVVAAGAGVAGEIFLRTELDRVYVDADDDAPAFFPRAADEGEVAFVERAHGGDEADGFTGTNPGGALAADGSEGADDFHKTSWRLSEKKGGSRRIAP